MFVPVCFTHAWSTGEGDLLGGGGIFTFYSYHTLFWNSLQAVYKWLCSLRFIPWTLVLTQVMTAGLAVVPGRWTHLFRKCLQVQVLWGRGTGQGTQKARLPLPVKWKETGSDGWGVKEKKKPFPSSKKKKKEGKKDHRVRSHSFLSSTSQPFPLSRVHKHTVPGSTEEGRTGCVNNPAGSVQPTHARVTTLVVLTKLHHTSRKKDILHPLIKIIQLQMPLHFLEGSCQCSLIHVATAVNTLFCLSPLKHGSGVSGEMVSALDSWAGQARSRHTTGVNTVV